MRNDKAFRAVLAKASLTLGVAMSISGCQREFPSAPHVNGRGIHADIVSQGGQPFYYYQHQPVALTVDPTQLVVKSSLRDPAAVRGALATAGTTVDSVRPLAIAGHWLAILPPGTTVAAAIHTRASLRHHFAFVGHAYHTADGTASFALLDHVIVRFKGGVTPTEIANFIAQLGLIVQHAPHADSAQFNYWLQYPADTVSDPLAIAAALDADPLVEWSDPDKVGDEHHMSVPTDPYFSFQWFLSNPITRNGTTVDDNVEAAWNLTTGSSSINVAVIDDGVDFTQTDITNIGGGYDLLYPCMCSDPVQGEDAFHPVHNDMHGTAVAGIIAAAQNNGKGGTGIAPKSVITSIRIFRDNYPPFAPGETASDGQIANGIAWAWSNDGSAILSNSWGGGAVSNAIASAVSDAQTKGRGGIGSVVVFAAGNNAPSNDHGQPGPLSWQAQLPGVIAVGAIDRHGLLADYSSTGSGLSVVAPSGHETNACYDGSDLGIVTTDLFGSGGCNDGPNGDINFTSTFSGTSAATPQVSGVVALLLAREPGLTPAQVKARITGGADPWGSANQFGSGKLNAFAVLSPVAAGISGPYDITVAGTYTWTVSASGYQGGYTYQWAYQDQGIPGWGNLGTGTSASRHVTSLTAPAFTLRVIVTSGTQQATAYYDVTNELANQCNPTC